MVFSTVIVFTAVFAPALYIACSVLWSRDIYRLRALSEGVGFPHPSDLILGLASSVLVVCVRLVVVPPFEKLGRRVLSSKNAAIEDRVQRFAAVLFKTIFYTIMTGVGYCLLMDEPWFPTELGGGGDTSLTIIGWPAHYVSERLRLYFLVQLAYKGHELLYLASEGCARNDWFEMSIHHACTLLLMCLSWGLNWSRLAALVLFIHDAGDVFTYAIKVVVDTEKKLPIFVLYFGVLLAWGWTRLYIFPALVIRKAFLLGPDYVGASAYAFSALLSMLLALHCYWYILILQMGYKAANTGKPEDTYQRHDE